MIKSDSLSPILKRIDLKIIIYISIKKIIFIMSQKPILKKIQDILRRT